MNMGVNNGYQKTKKKGGYIPIIVFVVCMSIVAIMYFFAFYNSSKYYVAKMPNFSAGTVKVDGYMHKSKTCCQAVANQFGAEVIAVRPGQRAGVNSYGQVLKYSDAFNYCPICCN